MARRVLLAGLMLLGSIPLASCTMEAPRNFTHFSSPNGFGMSAAVLNNGNAIELTNGGSSQSASIFTSRPVDIRAFKAAFTYQISNPGRGGPADGIAFVLQRDPRGTKALGQDGASLGYGGEGAIEHSAAFQLNVMANNTVGFAVHSDGETGFYTPTTPVNLASGDPIRIKLHFDGMRLHVKLCDKKTGQRFAMEQVWNPVASVGADTALIGFTGSSGSQDARQVVSQFCYKSVRPTWRKQMTAVATVNPFIGTTNEGEMFPGAVAPFGMVQLSPDTRNHSMGYYWRNPEIYGFSMLHMSGVGCPNGGDVFFTGTTGPVEVAPKDYHSPYSHGDESAHPGFYQVRLLKPNINVELTATVHAGLAKFIFPARQQANILIPISHTLTNTHQAEIQIVSDREIEGMVKSQTFCGSHHFYRVYFVMRFSHRFKSFGTWSGSKVAANSKFAKQGNWHQSPIGAYVSWPAGPARTVTASIGISFVDLAGARNNLATEVGVRDFAQVRHSTSRQWKNVLNRITVSGGTLSDRIKFYTALYHAALMPSVFSDVDGRYIGFDQRIHRLKVGDVQYANYSGWDIYRTEAPLLCLLFPKRMAQMCQSLVRDYRQGGWMPRWPHYNFYTNVMCGSPLTSVICTAYRYGIHNFDVQTAYQAMLKDATQAPPRGKPYAGESNIGYINQVHYDPQDKEGYGAVSQTEEDCYAYSALAELAQDLGKHADAQMLRKRAMYYRNLFDPSTHWMRPRNLDGSWSKPFKPTQAHGYIEGYGWQYLWLVPHDVTGLVNLMGRRLFNQRMDLFFRVVNQWNDTNYNPYNEPDLQAPFLYNWSGKPWKTQSLVRRLCASVYGAGPAAAMIGRNTGYANDDCGTMASWLIFSMMGFYPVDPASGTFVVCSPVFKTVFIQLHRPYRGHEFTIVARGASASNKYIESMAVDGATQSKCWFDQQVLGHGGTLELKLGARPNRDWGVGAANEPPSLSVTHPGLLTH
ncbi:MAG: glycoside hydrolase family 92 protein [Phycisphaerales bacterium]|nr:glycoside hydrolase family 92 protein [Phycisphaerales bacterium]